MVDVGDCGNWPSPWCVGRDLYFRRHFRRHFAAIRPRSHPV